jgi:di/tricarboxylate transporter
VSIRLDGEAAHVRGGYRFLDYPRVGLPLNVLMGVVTALPAPLAWPF